jgi:ElaA protein
MNISIKTFEQLSTKELYYILRLRSEVFVVEQDCVYQDVDDKDQKALHVLGIKDDKLVAYARIFKPGDYFKNTSIGRVVVKKEERKYGFGKDIMLGSLKAIKEEIGLVKVELSAQVYLKRFYNDLGFIEIGEGYLEDGIPHIRMLKKPN